MILNRLLSVLSRSLWWSGFFIGFSSGLLFHLLLHLAMEHP